MLVFFDLSRAMLLFLGYLFGRRYSRTASGSVGTKVYDLCSLDSKHAILLDTKDLKSVICIVILVYVHSIPFRHANTLSTYTALPKSSKSNAYS